MALPHLIPLGYDAFVRTCYRLAMKEWKKISVLLVPAQYTALREEALRQAAKNGGHADASAIIRGLVERWMKSRRA